MEPAPTGAGRPRLVIREMVLENFKSYAGVQRVGPFHKVRRRPGRPPPAAAPPPRAAPPAPGGFAEAAPAHAARKHQSFSSVVGPNGSGKSNVIDALLFVFGKRAKQARALPGLGGQLNGLLEVGGALTRSARSCA